MKMMLQIVGSLTDEPEGIIDNQYFIIQAIGCTNTTVLLQLVIENEMFAKPVISEQITLLVSTL
jgi:hypothetical protein